MAKRLSLRSTGIIVASAAIFAFFLGLVVAGALNLTQHARTEESTTPVPLVTEKGESPFVAVASAASPAVVNISTEGTVEVPGFGFGLPFDDFFRGFFGPSPRTQRPPVREKTRSLGSGVIIDEAGHILTNNHVIKNADEITIRLPDKTVYSGKKVRVLGRDPNTDVALLKIEDNRKFPHVRLGNSDEIKIGDWAIAIGNPFGFENSVTVGVISAKGRSHLDLPDAPTYQDFIQTDASINPGNSGGPLINIRGEVIGLNAAITSNTGTSIGIGFAIPINMARHVADQLLAHGKVTRGYLGVRPQEITEEIKDGMKLPSTEGVLIAEIVEGSPAAKSGLRAGDVVVHFDGQKITDLEQFRRIVADVPPGKDVTVEVLRNRKSLTLRARLVEYPSERTAAPDRSGEPWLGLTVRSLTSDERTRLKIDHGVMIEDIADGSPASRAGIRSGDAIMSVQVEDRTWPVEDLAGFERIRRDLANSKSTVVFQVRRENMSIYVAVRPQE